MVDKTRFIDLTTKEVPDGLSGTNMTRLRYLSSICNTEFLSEDEIVCLINRLKKTSNETEKTSIKNKLLVSYQPLIFSLATKYATSGNQMDYVNEASICFLGAIDAYDPAKSSLTTYMINCIVNHFSNIYKNNNGSVYVPVRSTDMKKLRRLISKFVNDNEREPTEDELIEMCEENNITSSYIENILLENVYIPMDAMDSISSEAKNVFALDKYMDKMSVSMDTSSIDKEYIISSINDYCRKYVKTIKSKCTRAKFMRNVQMVLDYYGVTDGEPKSYSYLSDKYGVCEEMARLCVRDTVKLLSTILPKEKLCA